MKLCGYILAFYVLLLATVPCCIYDNCPDDNTGQTARHEKGDDGCGACSPFFSCVSCVAAVIAYEPARFEIAALEQEVVYSAYFQVLLPQTDYDFWQPPKIG